MEPELFFFQDIDKLNKAVITSLMLFAYETVSETGRFSIALSGGKTPLSLYSMMAQDNVKNNFPYFNTYFFWGDERFVPNNHSENNFKRAKEIFLSKTNIPEENIFPVFPLYKKNIPIEQYAQEYEKKIKNFFAETLNDKSADTPLFDVTLLGIGTDGHTASLFPNDKALCETDKLVVPALAPPEYTVRERITVTLPLINRSRRVYFIVSGNEKQKIVDIIINDPEQAERVYPAARVTAKERLMWYLHNIKI